MRLLGALMLLLVLGQTAFAQDCDATASPLLQIPAPNPSSDEFVRNISQLEQQKSEVLLIGDSMVRRWPELQMQEAFGGTVANFGLDGDRIQNVLARVPQIRVKQPAPSLIVLWVGTNNIARGDTPCSIAIGMANLISVIRREWPTARMLVLDVIPRGEQLRMNEETRTQVNDALRSAQIGSGYKFVETSKYLQCFSSPFEPSVVSLQRDEETSFQCNNFRTDLTHLSPVGYAALSSILKTQNL